MEKRVLVVDDESCIVHLVTTTLQRGGYCVEAASDGEAAMTKAQSFQPHLLVLDVMMPKENGYRVSRRIKTQEGVSIDAVPKVLLVTGRRLDDDPDRETMFMKFSMADDIVYKPFDIRDLIAKVQELIG